MSYQVQSTAAYDTTCGAPYGIVSNIEPCARNNVGLDAALRPDADFPGGSSSFSLSSSIPFNGDPVDPVTGAPPPASPRTSPTDALDKAIAASDFVSTTDAAVECDDTGLSATAFRHLGYGGLIPLLKDACNEDTTRLIRRVGTPGHVDRRRAAHDL